MKEEEFIVDTLDPNVISKARAYASSMNFTGIKLFNFLRNVEGQIRVARWKEETEGQSGSIVAVNKARLDSHLNSTFDYWKE